jgi:hypothetical protein
MADKSRDWARVQKYVDVDALLGQFIGAGVRQSINPQDPKASAYVAALAQGTKPSFVKVQKQSMRKRVESGPAAKATTKDFMWSILDVKKVESVSYVGGKAHVKVAVSNGNGTTMDLTLTMERAGRSWRVVGIDNMVDLIPTSK